MSSNGAGAVTGEVIAAQGLVPKRRFPEFRDAAEWGYRTLGSFAKILDERAGNRAYTPYSITSGLGLVSQQEKFGRIIAGTQLKNYLILQYEDFAYNKSATKEYPQGFAVIFDDNVIGCVPASIFTCFRIHDASVSAPYLNFLLRGNLHGRWLASYSAVGARANGSLAIDDRDLLALPVPLPTGSTSRKEQQKIADCLSSLDAVIAAEGERLAALRMHKKGLMQALFPDPGQTTPRLRFPQFQGSGEWAMADLAEVAFFQEGPGIMAVDFHDEGVPLVRLSGVSGTSVTLDGCNYLDPKKVNEKWPHFCLNVEDLVISTSATFGLIATVTEVAAGSVFYTGLIRFRPHDNQLDAGYLKTFLGSEPFARQVDAAAVGGGIKHFGPTHLKQMKMPLPRVDEQKSIANCLNGFDDVIGASAVRLKALKTHKAGLMQQLFPSPAEATA